MLTKQQLKILDVFRKDLFARLTFKQIKERSRQNSNNVTQIALKTFKKHNLVLTQETGDVTTYCLKLDSNLTLSYLNLLNELELSRNKKIPHKILKDIQDRLFKHSEFFILIVFGSYANRKASKKSDLDIAVIVESEASKKDVLPYLETVKRREVIKIDYHVFTRKEFIEMLSIDQENVGKEIYRKHIVYYGATAFYNLIKGVPYAQSI